MKTTAALAAPHPRAPSMPADGGSDGSFAATLGLARAPAKAAIDRPVKAQAAAPPQPAPKLPAKPTSGAASEPGRSAQARAEEPAEAPVSADAVLPTPGWPSMPLVADAATAALLVGTSGTPVEAGTDADLASALSLDAASSDKTAPTPGKSRTAQPTGGGLVALASAGALAVDAEPTAAKTPAAASAAVAAATPLATSASDALATTAPPWSAAAAPLAGAAASAPAAATPAAAQPFAAHLAAAIDSPGFAPALATQVSWLVQEGLQLARLTLNPADMGPVAVRIVLEGTQARVDFSAALASTRAAIEASLPTLAAALHDNGMTLAGGGVSDGQARSGAQGEHSRQLPGHSGPAARSEAGAGGPGLPPRAARGLVDLVA